MTLGRLNPFRSLNGRRHAWSSKTLGYIDRRDASECHGCSRPYAYTDAGRCIAPSDHRSIPCGTPPLLLTPPECIRREDLIHPFESLSFLEDKRGTLCRFAQLALSRLSRVFRLRGVLPSMQVSGAMTTVGDIGTVMVRELPWKEAGVGWFGPRRPSSACER